MKEIGLFDTEKVRIKGQEVEVLKYQKEFGGKLGSIKTEKIGTKFRTAQDAANDAMLEFREGIRDYIWQDIAANINIIQITGGDLAFFGNSVNYQKRIAMFHSPGIHLMHNEKYDDVYLRSVHISDDEIISDVKENALIALDRYKDSLDSSAFPSGATYSAFWSLGSGRAFLSTFWFTVRGIFSICIMAAGTI